MKHKCFRILYLNLCMITQLHTISLLNQWRANQACLLRHSLVYANYYQKILQTTQTPQEKASVAYLKRLLESRIHVVRSWTLLELQQYEWVQLYVLFYGYCVCHLIDICSYCYRIFQRMESIDICNTLSKGNYYLSAPWQNSGYMSSARANIVADWHYI